MKVCANIVAFPEPMSSLELMCDKKQNAQLDTTFSYFVYIVFQNWRLFFADDYPKQSHEMPW